MTGGGSKGELILYRTEDGRAAIRLRAVDGTVWLTQAEIAALFDTTKQNITQHLRTIYGDGELEEAATCKDFLQVQQECGNPTVTDTTDRRVLAPRCAAPFRQAWVDRPLR
jgi:hypothetical protein